MVVQLSRQSRGSAHFAARLEGRALGVLALLQNWSRGAMLVAKRPNIGGGARGGASGVLLPPAQ